MGRQLVEARSAAEPGSSCPRRRTCCPAFRLTHSIPLSVIRPTAC